MIGGWTNIKRASWRQEVGVKGAEASRLDKARS